MSVLAIQFVAAVALMTFAGFVAVAPERRREYAIVDASGYAALLFVWTIAPHIPLTIEPHLAFSIFLFAKIAALFAFLLLRTGALADSFDAKRLAVFAFLVYALLIPSFTRTAIDGDEPYYVLIADSIAHDGDLDLRNQYANAAKLPVHRSDLAPQLGDMRGAHGEEHSRLEPFFPLMLIPGYLAGGIEGSITIVALFGALAVFSIMRLLEEENVSRETALAVAVSVAFAPPVLFYSLRLWPEVPGVFFFAESLRSLRARRPVRLLLCVLLLALLKLRFVVIALMLVALFFLVARRKWVAIGGAIAVSIPLVISWVATGAPFGVHSVSELAIQTPASYLRGLFGLIVDAQQGLLFQAPLLFLALFALARWSSLPEIAKQASIAAVPYLVLLLPRAEWWGGWSPPLRYLVVFVPLLAILLATIAETVSARIVAVAAFWSVAVAIHGTAYPSRLFHIGSGESTLGEFLSKRTHADFSRVLPSFVRMNDIALVIAVLFCAVFVTMAIGKTETMRRFGHSVWPAFSSVVLALLLVAATRPGPVVQLEDAHVVHRGGTLDPPFWTVARFRFRGAWTLGAGDAAEFRFRGGRASIVYSSAAAATIEDGVHRIALPATGGRFKTLAADVASRSGVTTLRCTSGRVTIDRIEHE